MLPGAPIGLDATGTAPRPLGECHVTTSMAAWHTIRPNRFCLTNMVTIHTLLLLLLPVPRGKRESAAAALNSQLLPNFLLDWTGRILMFTF